MLRINDKVQKAMTADAKAAYPDECCGFLFGLSLIHI